VEKVFESLVGKALDKVMDKEVNFFSKDPILCFKRLVGCAVACLLKFHLWTVLKAAMTKLGYLPKRESTQPFPPSKPYPKPSPSPKPSTSPKSEPAQPPNEVTVDICNHHHFCHFTK
jgi:hypothetical protein